MTKGIKTSEFWMTLAASVVGLLMASGAVSEVGMWGQLLALGGSLLGAFGYNVNRSSVKKAEANLKAWEQARQLRMKDAADRAERLEQLKSLGYIN